MEAGDKPGRLTLSPSEYPSVERYVMGLIELAQTKSPDPQLEYSWWIDPDQYLHINSRRVSNEVDC